MSNFVTEVNDTLTPPWGDQENTLGLAETATERVAQAFRLLSALQRTDEEFICSEQSMSRVALLNEMTDLLASQLVVMRQKLVEEQRKSCSLETILLRLATPHRAA